MPIYLIIFLGFWWAAGTVRDGYAQEFWSLLRGDGSDAVELRADTLAAQGGERELHAEGHVSLAWKEFRLRAQRVTFRPADGVAVAEGQVVLEDGDGNVLECRRLEINTVTEQGQVEEGTLWIAREGYRVWGRHFQKTGPRTYLVENGGFTTCDGTWPSWRAVAGKLEIELEGYLTARGASFWVEGVPVLYTPYILFPVKLERQSGFLFPKVGFTSMDGIHATVRYYWALADNADATFDLDYRSLRGWEESAELRYVLAEGHTGRVAGSYLQDRRKGEARYTVQADHVSQFTSASRARVHVDYVGDTTYLSDLGETLDERGVQRTRSFAVGTSDAEVGTLYGLMDYLQTLTESQGEVLQTLPSIGLLGRETPLVGPLVWAPTVRATRFWRERGEQGERLELVPRLGVGSNLGGLGLSARTGYRQNIYLTEDDLESRGGADAALAAELTLARRFGGFLHVADPQLSLLWEEAGRGDEVPLYDRNDVFERNAVARLLVENRLLGSTTLRTVAALDLQADYDLVDGHWLPFRGEVGWWPNDDIAFAADADYAPDAADPLVRWAARGSLRDSRQDRLYADYRYLKDTANYVDAGLEIPLRRVLTFQYRNRYSLHDDKVLEESYGLQLNHPCWVVHVSFSRNWREEDTTFERRYYIQLEITGLGRLGSMKGLLPQ